MLEWNYTYISSITNDEFNRYYLLMNGKKDPSFEVLFDIASALKVTVAELFE